MHFLYAFFLWFAVLLTACTAVPPIQYGDTEQLWLQRQEMLAGLERWNFVGRLALSDGNESWNISLRWQQQRQSYVLSLMNFLGQQLARLEGGPESVILYQSDAPPLSSVSAPALLAARFGWKMPVDDLRYWVIGLPDPRHEYRSILDERGRLASLDQSGWRVEYLDYHDVADVQLPRRMRLSHDGMNVRVVLGSWVLDKDFQK